MVNLAIRNIRPQTSGSHASPAPPELTISSFDETELEEKITRANRILSNNPRETFALAESVLATAEEDSTLFARALRSRGMAHGAQGRLEEASADFETAALLARHHADPILEAQCLHGLANVHHYRGEFAHALEHIQRANDLRREAQDDGGLMTGLNSQGAFLAEMGDLTIAVACFFDSLAIAQQIGSEVNEVLALTNIGHLKLESGETETAIAYLEESLALSARCGARIYEPFALEVLASALQKLNRLDEAFEAAQRGIQVSQETGNKHHEVATLCVLASIETEREHLPESESLLLQALDMAKTVQSGKSVATIYGVLGKLYTRTSDFASAERCLTLGLRSATERRQRQQVCELHRAFSELYSASGDFAKALASYAAYHEAYKTLEKESLQNRLEAQVARMAFQRARQEAEIHRLRTVELAIANAENERLLARIQQQSRRLAELAITDPLTGLYNRRFLREYLYRELSEASSLPPLFSLALLDLDDFKQINDRFSHQIGDEVLKATAQLIRRSIGENDIAVRYGGEEFVVILPNIPRNNAAAFCERIRQVIAAHDWSRIHPDLQVTTSIGLADSRETESELSGESLLLLADNRLYQAKASGKNRVL